MPHAETPDAIKDATKGYTFNHTMFRVRDPALSMAFYQDVLGMAMIKKLDFPDMSFSLYFLGYPDVSQDQSDIARAFGRPGVLELTHNWGTEKDTDFSGYHNGNSEPQGFGHIAICVPDVTAATDRFEELGVAFVKRPNDGRMKGLAFIQDPDGYWIEILSVTGMEALLEPFSL